ncbi:MAG: lysozyme [Xanthobacteraceae bacterium]
MARRNINAAGRKLVEDFEGCVLYVYDDLVPGRGGIYPEWTGTKPRGTLTIGFGHTNAGKHPLKIAKGLRITRDQAEQMLDVDLDRDEDTVARLVKVRLTDNQFAALVSFQYNTGALAKTSFLPLLNAGDYEAVPVGLRKYVMSKGKRLRGLVRRREAEVSLWLRGAPAIPRGECAPTATVIPDTPVDEVPLKKSGVIKGSVMAAISGTGLGFANGVEVVDQVQSGWDRISAGSVLGVVAGLLIVLGTGWSIYSRWDAAGRPKPWGTSE